MAEKKPKKDKRMLTLFFMITPSLLLAMASAIDSFYIRIFFQVVLIFFQIVIFKNFIDDYYGYSGDEDENNTN
jgi:hypothetical protein